MDIYIAYQIIVSVDEFYDILMRKFKKRYRIDLSKSGQEQNGSTFENDFYTISIRKNGYYGFVLKITSLNEGSDYSVISLSSYTPSGFIRKATQRSEFLNKLFYRFRTIWGDGDEFYQEIRDTIEFEYKAKKANSDLKKLIKQKLIKESILN